MSGNELAAEKQNAELGYLSVIPFAGHFYIASFEKIQLWSFILAYLMALLPMVLMSVGTKDFMVAVYAHIFWGFFLYLVVLRSSIRRAAHIKKIAKIAVTKSHLIELDVGGKEIRRIPYVGKEIAFKQRSAKTFDLEIKAFDALAFMFSSPLFKAIDYGDQPYLYIACNLDLSTMGACKDLLARGEK